jgi:hypothetical protein
MRSVGSCYLNIWYTIRLITSRLITSHLVPIGSRNLSRSVSALPSAPCPAATFSRSTHHPKRVIAAITATAVWSQCLLRVLPTAPSISATKTITRNVILQRTIATPCR